MGYNRRRFPGCFLMKHCIMLGVVAASLSACLQERAAPIEYKGSNFYGRSGTYDRWGNELPKYSAENPGRLADRQVDKYVSGAPEFGVTAEIASVSSSDLPPPPTLHSSLDPPPESERAVPAEGETGAGDSGPSVKWENDPFAKGQSKEVAEASADVAAILDETPAASQTVEAAGVQAAAPGAEPTFIWPVRGKVVAAYGKAGGRGGDGIQIAARAGEPIRAASDGAVAYADDAIEGYGNMAIIRHAGNWLSAYANAKELVVKKGDSVVKGQLIGFVGQSGDAAQPALHFSLRKDKQPVDPEPLLRDD